MKNILDKIPFKLVEQTIKQIIHLNMLLQEIVMLIKEYNKLKKSMILHQEDKGFKVFEKVNNFN